MALGALAEQPDCGLTIIPCGMNYFHAHKFRSRAVVEFGMPIKVPKELVTMFKEGNRRPAVGKLLDIIYDALVSVTVTSPDYDTLMLIQAVRRLYRPSNKKPPLPLVIQLNRWLIKGYSKHKDDPRIIHLKKSVLSYNERLRQLNLRDHQVEYARLPFYKVIGILLYRVAKLLVLSAGVLPGLVLFAPVFIISKIISYQKSKEALAASTVKVQARDVIATWKLLVSLALAPMLYMFYTIILAIWNSHNHVQGLVPEWVPTWLIIVFGYVFFPAITYAGLRFGEVGMDILKSLRPLVVALNPASENALSKLRNTRTALSLEVTKLITTLKPELAENSDLNDLMDDELSLDGSPTGLRFDFLGDYFSSPGGQVDEGSEDARFSHETQLPTGEDYTNIGNQGVFATRPGTPSYPRSRSRTSSNGGGVHVSTLASLPSGTSMSNLTELLRRERERKAMQRMMDGPTDAADGVTAGESSDDDDE